jgi:uncharacterized protein
MPGDNLTDRTSGGELTLCKLGSRHEEDVVVFLKQRPMHTFAMTGLIRDNGIESPHNRGTFYGCLDEDGAIKGVALIGHATLMETASDSAIEVFARAAQHQHDLHMLLGEEEKVRKFWSHYSTAGKPMRFSCREMLLELRWPVPACEEVTGLRLAVPNDLDLIIPAHAQLAIEESGVDPRSVDPDGFRARCLRRIEQRRTWVWIEENTLMFKADVVSDTPDVIYIEGVVVNRESRGKSYGLKCMSQLTRVLLSRTRSVCLLVSERNESAQAFYYRAGFKLASVYDTVFLEQSRR